MRVCYRKENECCQNILCHLIDEIACRHFVERQSKWNQKDSTKESLQLRGVTRVEEWNVCTIWRWVLMHLTYSRWRFERIRGPDGANNANRVVIPCKWRCNTLHKRLHLHYVFIQRPFFLFAINLFKKHTQTSPKNLAGPLPMEASRSWHIIDPSHVTLVTRLSGSSRQQKPSVGAAPLRDAWNAIVQNLGNYFSIMPSLAKVSVVVVIRRLRSRYATVLRQSRRLLYGG